jgi:hypothetical protein
MIKLIYKSFLIAVISGSLTAGNFVYALGPAQNNEDPTNVNINAGATTNTGNSSASPTQNWVKDKDGTLAQQEKHDFKGVQGNDMLSSITMLVIGVIGTRMAIAYNPKTTDVYVAAAGAAAFIAGEVMSNLKFSGEIKDMSVDITKRVDGKPNNEQIEILNKLKKSYEDAKGATQTKRMLQMAAAAGFGVAAGIAVYKAFTEETKDAQCVAALGMAKTQLTTCSAVTPSTPASAACAACLAPVATYLGTFETKKGQETPPEASAAKLAAGNALLASLKAEDPSHTCTAPASSISAAAVAACNLAVVEKAQNQTGGAPIKNGAINQQRLIEEILYGHPRLYTSLESEKLLVTKKSALDLLLDVLMPSAHAGWMPFIGLGAGIAAAYFAIQGPLAIQLDTLMYHPRNRAIVFGVLAGLSYMAAKSSENQIKQIQENIDKIDAILNELNNLTKGVSTGQGGPIAVTAPYTLPPGTFGPNTQNGEPKTNIPCATSNCSSLSDGLAKSAGFNELPSAFQQAAMDATKLGDSLSGPKGAMTAGAASQAGNLAAKQAAISKLAAKAQNKLNKQLGKNKVDFGKEQQALLNKLNSTVARVLKSKGQTPSNFLGSLGGSPIGGTGNLGNAANDAMKDDSTLAVTKGGSALDIGTGGDGKSKDLDLGLKDSGLSGGEGAGGGGKADGISKSNGDAGDPNAQYEMGAGDIASSKDNIFELITNRYMRSGYPVLLEETGTPTPAPVSEKK